MGSDSAEESLFAYVIIIISHIELLKRNYFSEIRKILFPDITYYIERFT